MARRVDPRALQDHASEPWAQGPGRGRCWGKSTCSGCPGWLCSPLLWGAGRGDAQQPLRHSPVLTPAFQVEGRGVGRVAQGREPVHPTPHRGRRGRGLPRSWSQTWETLSLQSFILSKHKPALPPPPWACPLIQFLLRHMLLLRHTALLLRSRGGAAPGCRQRRLLPGVSRCRCRCSAGGARQAGAESHGGHTELTTPAGQGHSEVWPVQRQTRDWAPTSHCPARPGTPQGRQEQHPEALPHGLGPSSSSPVLFLPSDLIILLFRFLPL